MKKVVSVSLVLASSTVLGQDYFESSAWTLNAAPNAQVSTSDCCYYTGPVAIDASGAATGNVGAGNTAVAACADFSAAPSIVGASGGNQVWTNTLTVGGTGATALTGTTAVAKGAASVGFAVTDNGNTLTVTPSSLSTGTATTCPAQTFSRTTTALSTLDGTWSVGTATGTGCCFLNTANNLVISTTGTRTSASGAKFATDTTNCVAANGASSGGDYTKTLKAPASGSSATAIDTANLDTFTLANGQITYRPSGSQTCSQVLTKVPSSGVHLASVMTPVVVGGAILGLVVV